MSAPAALAALAQRAKWRIAYGDRVSECCVMLGSGVALAIEPHDLPHDDSDIRVSIVLDVPTDRALPADAGLLQQWLSHLLLRLLTIIDKAAEAPR